MIGTTGTRRSLIVGLALAATAAGCGSYEVAYFAPEQGQGAFVTNGQRLAVAYRLAGDESAAQSFVALAIHQAYTAQASPGQRCITHTPSSIARQQATSRRAQRRQSTAVHPRREGRCVSTSLLTMRLFISRPQPRAASSQYSRSSRT